MAVYRVQRIQKLLRAAQEVLCPAEQWERLRPHYQALLKRDPRDLLVVRGRTSPGSAGSSPMSWQPSLSKSFNEHLLKLIRRYWCWSGSEWFRFGKDSKLLGQAFE